MAFARKKVVAVADAVRLKASSANLSWRVCVGGGEGGGRARARVRARARIVSVVEKGDTER